MTYRLATATRNAACNGNVDLLNSGTIEFRTGAQPTAVNDADSGDLCATVTFGATAFGDAATGVATANAIASDTNAADSGTVTHARIKTSGAAIHSDCAVSTSGSDINFDNNVIVAGGTVAVTSLTITQPV